MRCTPIRRLLLTSLLAGLSACNSQPNEHAGRPASIATAPQHARILATAPAATRPTTDPSFQVDVKRAIDYLASDELEGRRIGTPGIVKAGDFISGSFAKLGLRPLPGLEGYFQPFVLTEAIAPAKSTELRVNGQNCSLGQDFTAISFSAEEAFDGEVVFAGYGISDDEHGYDDYKDRDVNGKVVVAMRFEPHDAGGKSRFSEMDWSSAARLERKAKNAADRGAAALILVDPPTFHPGDSLMPFARQYAGGHGSIPLLHARRSVVDAMLKIGGAPDLKTLQSKIDAEARPAFVALAGVKASGNVRVERQEHQLRNVAALLPGAGPAADEYVVVGAHYDHLGRGGPGSLAPRSKDIHHGADDNASGTVAMLALAQRYARLGPQPRSLIFIAFTGEEEGLIGSRHFVTHCPVPVPKIAYMLNLDMVGRVRNETIYVGGTGTATPFESVVKKADDDSPLAVKHFGRGGIGPSDHMSFALKKVPVLFLFSGLHSDYHRPTDAASKINFQGMDEVIAFAAEVTDALLRLPRERYVESADIGGRRELVGHGAGVTLGVVPDYGAGDEQVGVRIGGTVPGSPAEAAGLREGDVLLRFGEARIDTLYDLSDQLAAAKPGQKVHLVVQRDGSKLELDAVLAERKG